MKDAKRMRDRVDAIEANLPGASNSLDKLFGIVSGDMLTMNSDSGSSMPDCLIVVDHMNKIDDINT